MMKLWDGGSENFSYNRRKKKLVRFHALELDILFSLTSVDFREVIMLKVFERYLF